jgi:tetratricopeptide (TPR) repeat protein
MSLPCDFDSPDSKNFGVTETVINQLRQATGKYSDVKIQSLNKSITEQEGSEVARTEGEKRKATIVIWGWYRNTGEVAPLSVHFEVLRPPKNLPELGQTAKGQLQQAAIADLKSFTLQTRLSNEMSYLSLFTLGMTRYAAADWDGAIARFSDALSQSVERTTALNQSLVYFYRGYAYLQKGDSESALADLDRTIELQPEFAEAYGNRSMVYIAKGDYNRALADANQAIELQSDFALAHNNRGVVYLNVGDYDRAIADFTQTLKLMPNTADSANILPSNDRQLGTILQDDREVFIANFLSSELSDYLLYNNRGTAYLYKEDYDRALADFNQAIKIQPNRAFAYVNRAGIYGAKENYDLAIADCSQVIKLQPDFALAYMKRGIFYLFKGDRDRAIADLNQGIKLQPDLALAYASRGEIYYHKGDYNLAISDYNQVLKLKPDYFEIYNARALAYAKQGDYDQAIADYNQAIKLKPDFALAYNNRGISYKNKGDYDRAIADYNQAIRLKPDYALAYHNRGNAYGKKGDYDRAIIDHNQAIKLEPDKASHYNDRGYTYALKGDYDRALADAKQALKLEPNSAGAYDTRGFAFAGKGDYPGAIADYNQALKLIEDKGKTISDIDIKKNVTTTYTYDVDRIYYHRGLAYRKQGKKDRAISDFKKTLELTKESKMRQDAEKQLKELGVK